jgi:hypothetical protein
MTRTLRVGDAAQPGACLKACGRCTPCPPGDLPCYNRLRRAAGYLEVEEAEARLFPNLPPVPAPPAGGGAGSQGEGAGGVRTEL